MSPQTLETIVAERDGLRARLRALEQECDDNERWYLKEREDLYQCRGKLQAAEARCAALEAALRQIAETTWVTPQAAKDHARAALVVVDGQEGQ